MKCRLLQVFKLLAFTSLLFFPLIMAGCDEGSTASTSTTSSGSALSVGAKVSVVDSQDSGSSSSSVSLNTLVKALKMGNIRLMGAGALPATSAYNTDTVFVYVDEPSAEPLDMINEILCMMDQSQYDVMVNKGVYKAQIDMGQCKSGNDDASEAAQGSQNQSSGSGAPSYEFWTVESSRADDSSPHTVKVWIHQESSGFNPAGIIEIGLTITEGSSTTNPYGLFEMMFKSYAEATPDTIMFKGSLKASLDASSQVVLHFYMDGAFGVPNQEGGTDSIVFDEKISITRGADGTSGAGTISQTDSFAGNSTTKSYNIAYNSSHFFREDQTSKQVCMARANPDVTAMRYGLYHDENSATPGAQLDINSGFPIKYTSGGVDYNGWVGFWGVWLPGGITLSDGDSVTKQSFNGGAEATYTLVVKPGKLKKYTKQALSLAEIKNLPFDYMETVLNVSTTYKVKWDGNNFVKFKQRDETNWVWKNIIEANLDLSSLNWDSLNFWSQALGGQVRVDLQNCTSSGGKRDCSNFTKAGDIVTLFAETTITPTATVPSTLRCISNCPDPSTFTGITKVNPLSNPYFGDINQFQNVLPAVASFKDYTFSTDTMLLAFDGTNVTLTDSDSTSSGAYQWGVMSGPLFENTTANLDALACDMNNDSTNESTCGWNAWNGLSEFYVWETGPSSWNQLSLLQNPADNTYLTFDSPKQVTYVRDASATLYPGTNFYLDYNGFGDLLGIPGKCVDMETGDDTDCFQSEGGGKHIRWVNEFSIPDGTAVTSGGTTYYTKAIEKEERMNAVAASACTDSGLTLATYALPDSTIWTDPNNGTEPDVKDASPSVIGGVVQ